MKEGRRGVGFGLGVFFCKCVWSSMFGCQENVVKENEERKKKSWVRIFSAYVFGCQEKCGERKRRKEEGGVR